MDEEPKTKEKYTQQKYLQRTSEIAKQQNGQRNNRTNKRMIQNKIVFETMKKATEIQSEIEQYRSDIES